MTQSRLVNVDRIEGASNYQRAWPTNSSLTFGIHCCGMLLGNLYNKTQIIQQEKAKKKQQ
jgi:hypothetical protein